MTKIKKVKVTITISKEAKEILEKIAKEEKCSVSEATELAVRYTLKREENGFVK
jgi:DNA-directed RNA polymerase subunit F